MTELPNSKHNSSNSSVVYLAKNWLPYGKKKKYAQTEERTHSRPSSLKRAALSTEIVGIARRIYGRRTTEGGFGSRYWEQVDKKLDLLLLEAEQARAGDSVLPSTRRECFLTRSVTHFSGPSEAARTATAPLVAVASAAPKAPHQPHNPFARASQARVSRAAEPYPDRPASEPQAHGQTFGHLQHQIRPPVCFPRLLIIPIQAEALLCHF